jgi:ABC-type sugar transport system ATPase subunit
MSTPTVPDQQPRAPAAVSCHGLVKRYGREVTALGDVSVFCPAGKVLVLLGPSGCGKTTLLRSIAGLEAVDAGTILIGDRDVTRDGAHTRGVAMVFQNYALYPGKTARANIEFPLKMARHRRAARMARVQEMAALLQIEELLDRRPSQMSGGQRQRVGIARALARQPRVVLMDEPLSNLDAELRTTMRAELRRLQRRLEMTMLYVTHDQSEAMAIADQLVVMKSGIVQQSGAPADVFRKPANDFVAFFLGGMSFLPGTLGGRGLETAGAAGTAHVAPSAPGVAAAAARDVRIGLRPEDVRLGDGDPGSLTVSGHIVLAELLGREQIVHIDVDGTSLRARMSADTPLSERVSVHCRAEDLHIFDLSGARVELQSDDCPRFAMSHTPMGERPS